MVAVARALGWMPRGLARFCAGDWPGPSITAWAVCGAWASGILRWHCRSCRLKRAEICCGDYRHLGWQLVEFCRMPRYTRREHAAIMRTEGLEHYLAARGAGQGSAGSNRAPGRVGTLQLLPLADGPSDGDGDPAARQSQARRVREPHSLPAWQSRTA